jgi:hypothetical protein
MNNILLSVIFYTMTAQRAKSIKFNDSANNYYYYIIICYYAYHTVSPCVHACIPQRIPLRNGNDFLIKNKNVLASKQPYDVMF